MSEIDRQDTIREIIETTLPSITSITEKVTATLTARRQIDAPRPQSSCPHSQTLSCCPMLMKTYSISVNLIYFNITVGFSKTLLFGEGLGKVGNFIHT